MKNYPQRIFLLFAVCALLTMTTTAQSSDERGKNELSVWGGFSPASSTIIRGTGRTPDARLGIFNVRYARRFNNNDTINLKYTIDVTPLAVLSFPDFDYVRTGANTYRAVSPQRSTRYAFGFSPVGLQGNFRPRKKLQPFVEGTGGLLFFNKDTPTFIGKKLGFTADVGAGIEYQLKDGRAVTFGYKYFHISNANRGLENPGFDNNLIYVGYRFLSK